MTDARAEPDDATALAAAIRRGETTACAALEASLARIARRADLGAVVRLAPAIGREAAEGFDALFRRGSPRATGAPFGGVPFLMKDLGNAARGLPPTAGSAALARRASVAAADSALARRFRRAGLIPFGLTTTPEFGLALTAEPPGGPVARNPFDAALSPGGSSGGAAAAVAAGLVALAHATDAAGSIRVPAAACGLFGLKPTRGATPNGPDFGNHLGGIVGELVVARSLRDLRSALLCAAGDGAGPCCDPDLSAYEPGRLRIAVVADGPGLAIGPDAAAAVEEAAAVLAAAGHRIVGSDPATLAGLAGRADRVARAILSVSLAAWMEAVGVGAAEMSPLAAAVRAEGARMPATALFAAETDGVRVAHALWRIFERCDAILTPVLADGIPAVGAFPTDHTDTDGHFARMAATAPFAALANVGGMPALAAPLGLDTRGRPRSVQLIGPMGADLLLLDAAEALAAARPIAFPAPVAGGRP